jgi:predicted O-methyltransferase YrrM
MEWLFAHEIASAVTLDESRRLAALAEGKLALEVGSWFGRSTVALASTAEAVHCIDWHRGETIALDGSYREPALDSLVGWRDNIARYGLLDRVVLHMGTTKQVCPALMPQHFDLVFVDADHTYEGVCADIAFTMPLLKPDGIMCFHDFTFDDLGVAKACRAVIGGEPDEIVDSLAIYCP